MVTGVGAGDLCGEAVAGAGDLDGDGRDDLLLGGFLWPGDGTSRGATWVLYGPLADGTVDAAGARIVGEVDQDGTGDTLAGVGDVNGDGLADFVMGAPLAEEANYGAVYLFHGPLAGDVTVADAAGTLVAQMASEHLGRSVASLGDADGDGAAEIAMGANGADRSGENDVGAVYVIDGDELTGARDTNGLAQLEGLEGSALLGTTVAAGGDLDGDGLGDLVAAAYQADEGGVDFGVVYVVFGPVDGRRTVEEADARLIGNGGETGRGLAGLGDVDGDGHADLGVGAPNASFAMPSGGAAYVVLGPFAGARSMDDADGRVDGEAHLGEAVLGPGDLDGDGQPDFLAGAPNLPDGENGNAGGVYLFYGGPRGVVTPADADARWVGDGTNLGLGGALAPAGDTDGDGVPELLFGTQVNESASVLGGVWVVPARP